jgi:rhodanese-related sulfurtransferase
VHPDQPLRLLQRGGERRDRQRRGVAGEDCRARADDLERLEQAQFCGGILRDRFDHEARGRECIEAVAAGDAAEGAVALLRRQVALVDRSGERSSDALFGLRQRGLFGVVKEHAVAGRGRDLRNAGAHGAGTNYGDGNFGRKRRHQRPRNVGWRLAMNAATPSR